MSHRTMTVRLERIAACRLDLLDNGIDVSRQTPGELAALVGEHLEYFQLMLGDDSTPGQVIALIRKDLAKVAAKKRPAPGKGAWNADVPLRRAAGVPVRHGKVGGARGETGRRDPERAGARGRVCVGR